MPRGGPLVNGSARGVQRSHLSFWKIWNMSFGFLGIQFGWALQMANVSAIYEYLGADAHQIPILWLAVAPTSSRARCWPPSRSLPCPIRRRYGWRQGCFG